MGMRCIPSLFKKQNRQRTLKEVKNPPKNNNSLNNDIRRTTGIINMPTLNKSGLKPNYNNKTIEPTEINNLISFL